MTEQVGSGATGGGGRAAITIGLCFLVALFEGIDLQAAGVTAPQIAPLFKLSPEKLGIFFSASTFGLLIGAAVGGPAADLIGRKRALIGSTILFGIFSCFTVMAADFNGLVAMRVLTGLGLGGALPIIIALVTENCLPTQRNLAVGLTYAGLPLGGALASTITLVGGAASTWKIVFLVGGLTPLLLAPALALWLPESAEHRAVKRMAGPSAAPRTSLAVVFEGRIVNSILLWFSFFFTLLILYLLINWLPLLLVRHGFSRQQASAVQLTFSLASAVGSVLVGRLMDGSHRTIAAALIYGATVLALIWLANVPRALPWAMLVGACVGLTVLGAQTILFGLASRCYPTAVRGAGAGAAIVAGRLGSLTGPPLAALFISSGAGSTAVVWRLIPLIVAAAVTAVTLVARTPMIAGSELRKAET